MRLQHLRLYLLSCLFFFVCCSTVFAQAFSFEKAEVRKRISDDINRLASEEFEGREAGTPGEQMAVDYIMHRMIEAGLKPLYKPQCYQQVFTFNKGFFLSDANHLTVNGKDYKPETEYIPLVYSANGIAKGKAFYAGHGFEDKNIWGSPYKNVKGLKGKIFVMEYFIPDAISKKIKLTHDELLNIRIKTAVEKGASGVIFVNTTGSFSDPNFSMPRRHEPSEIPVVFLKDFKDAQVFKSNKVRIELAVELLENKPDGINTGGIIDNNAPYTIIFGAHHDHVGRGGETSREPLSKDIHFGADDNASGVAGLLEMARYLGVYGNKDFNYVFLTFSAEEVGLLGSEHFVNSGAYDLSKVSCMINFDMIGRCVDSTLSLIGTGTSPSWNSIISGANVDSLKINMNMGGIGGSDHSSFYLKNIPVLFFFTGVHEDYHKPSDTPDKINFDGMIAILDYAKRLIVAVEEQSPLEFTESDTRPDANLRRSGPTLGIMPDVGMGGTGLRVVKVMDGIAKKVGIHDGDIIVKLGDFNILDIESYMHALANHRKGDKVKVEVKRGDKILSFDVEF